MKVIAVATAKGGVGKTILSAHLAAGLARRGRRTLLMDLDPQGHASVLVGIDVAGDYPCAGDALIRENQTALDDVIYREVRPNLDVAPSAPRMGAQERQLYAWALRLRSVVKALESLSDPPEAVVIDCPPYIGGFMEAALHAADLTLAPLPALAGSSKGVIDLQSAWLEMRDGRPGKMAGVINLWDPRTSVTNSVVFETIRGLGIELLGTRIPRAEVVNQAALRRGLLFDYAPKHPVSYLFEELAEEAWAMVDGYQDDPDEGESAWSIEMSDEGWTSPMVTRLRSAWSIPSEAYLDSSYYVDDGGQAPTL